jgi:hypothetical protein
LWAVKRKLILLERPPVVTPVAAPPADPQAADAPARP